MEAEETETASKGEGSFEVVNKEAVSRGRQVNIEVETLKMSFCYLIIMRI